MKDEAYKTVASQETLFSTRPFIGVRTQVSLTRDLTDEELDYVSGMVSSVVDFIDAMNIKLDPATAEQTKENRENVLALFPSPIFVEEIGNKYSRKGHCAHLPWFAVTTPKGHITIGWRKRVIEIDWSKSIIEVHADELFPDEAVTMGDKYIHAWGYAKAAEYVDRLLNTKESA